MDERDRKRSAAEEGQDLRQTTAVGHQKDDEAGCKGERQRADFAALANQDQLILPFYEDELRHRLSKLIPAGLDRRIPAMLARAEELRVLFLLGGTISTRRRPL